MYMSRHRLLQRLLDRVAHKVRARVAVGAVAVEDAEEQVRLRAVELLDHLERVLVRLVQVLGVVAALREVGVPQRDARLAELVVG